MISRRTVLGTGAVAAATLAAPWILHAQTKTLKITTWGGKWGEIMKATVLPAFEKEFKCTVQADQAFPFVPKLQASSKNDPIYDVLHTNSNEQWNSFTEGLVMAKITPKEAPNVADVYPWEIFGEDLYPPDAALEPMTRTDESHLVTGPEGTLILCDTTGFHRGGFASERPRIMGDWNYVSPASLASLSERNFRTEPPLDAAEPVRYALT